jgi:Domain of unknown function (DUF5666)
MFPVSPYDLKEIPVPVITSRPRLATLLTAVVTTTVALTLAGCGPSGTAAAPASGTQSGGTQNGQGGNRGQGGARQPGVSGLIAAVSGKTLQVQGTDGQTAVSYTGKTTITDVATATAAALKTGLCATVRSTGDGSSASPTDQLTAVSVSLSPAVNGKCETGFGGGGGGRPGGAPSGAPSSLPSGGPSNRPSGAPGGRGGFGFGANGLVSSVSGTTFVVDSNRPNGNGSMAAKVTVTTTSATTWSEVKTATSKAIVVGRCALAIGKTSDTGAVAATSLRISKPTNGSCFTGGRGPGQPNGGGRTGQPGNGQGNG